MRYFIELSYKGTNYHGWQYQPNAISVQEKINEALSKLLKTSVNIMGAGRTDAGVHATQMFAHFDVETDFDKDVLLFKINSFLPDDIVIYRFIKVEDKAHTRFDATARSYEYRIYLGRDPFQLETTWQFFHRTLDVDEMNKAAKELLTHTNFKCFSKSGVDVKTFNCDVREAQWVLTNNMLVFHITADRFLRNMVRAIVGTLVDVGLGRKTLDDFKTVLLSKDRTKAGTSVPAKGLFLTKIDYPKTTLINE